MSKKKTTPTVIIGNDYGHETENLCTEVSQEHIEQLLAHLATLSNIPVPEKLTGLDNKDMLWIYSKIRNIIRLFDSTLGYDSISEEIFLNETRFSDYTKIALLKISPKKTKNLLIQLATLFGIIPDENLENPVNEQLLFFYKKLKEITTVLNTIQNYDWNFDCSSLPKMIFPYLMDNTVTIEKRNEVFTSLMDHLIFNSSILENKRLINYFGLFLEFCLKNIEDYFDPAELKREPVNCKLDGKVSVKNEELQPVLLDLAEVLFPTSSPIQSKYKRLSALNSRIKQNIKLLKNLKNFPWCDDFPAIQQGILNYLMDFQLPKKTRCEKNAGIVKRLNFHVFMTKQNEILTLFLDFHLRLMQHIRFYMDNLESSVNHQKETENKAIQDEI